MMHAKLVFKYSDIYIIFFFNFDNNSFCVSEISTMHEMFQIATQGKFIFTFILLETYPIS